MITEINGKDFIKTENAHVILTMAPLSQELCQIPYIKNSFAVSIVSSFFSDGCIMQRLKCSSELSPSLTRKIQAAVIKTLSWK